MFYVVPTLGALIGYKRIFNCFPQHLHLIPNSVPVRLKKFIALSHR